ncbi:MAG: tryptophan 2,3-dioxygenase family protein, partial [Nitriliruptorales bacterium]|nr:tryptophan 2,3-dioxygenase family protein [Nitriliruptorales bacterium]
DYLQLDRLLDSQELESDKRGAHAHDEMLFIIVHQAYELWFKQILWELDAVIDVMGREVVADHAMARVVSALDRVIEIQPLLIQQLDVLETMTPLDFLDFRDYLVPASGFQSVQFRLIENRMGIDPDFRLKIKGSRYTTRLSEEHSELLAKSEDEPTLLGAVNAWLERTPFLQFGDFDFWEAYRDAVEDMIERDRRVIEENPNLDEVSRQQQLDAFEQTVSTFETLFDEDQYRDLREQNKRRLSREAFLAALLISLYRDQPVFHMPFQLLTALIDLDEGFTNWRYRHALMVHRMIGGRIGTGGTSGHEYLRAAADKHKVFVDLFELPTYFLPRSELPELPAEVTRQMGFRYASDQ